MSLYVPPLFPAEVIDKGGQVYNVKAYGAKGDGISDDTAARQNTVNAAVAAGGGIIFSPPGTYLGSAPIVTPNTAVNLRFVGAGEGLTTWIGNGSSFSSVLNFLCNGSIEDMTLDGGGGDITQAVLGVGNLAGQSALSFKQKVKNVTVQNNPAGSWVFVCWDQNQTYQIDSLELENVTVKGPSNTAGDAFAVSYVNRCTVSNLNFISLARTPNFYVVKTLEADNIFSDGATSTGAIVFDAGVESATVNNLQIIPGAGRAAGPIINTPYLAGSNWVLGAGCNTALNPTGSVGTPIVRLSNCKLALLQLSQSVAEISILGGSISSTDSIVEDVSPAGSNTGLVKLVSVECLGSSAVPPFRAANAVTWARLEVEGGSWSGFAGSPPYAFSNITLGAFSYNRGIKGQNPVGLVTVAVPASGTAVPTTYYDRTLYITASTSTVAIAVTDAGGTPQTVATIPASGFAGVFVPAGSTLTPTYTAAPTWTVQGH